MVLLCTDGIDERGGCWGKRGVLAPGEIDVADERGRERAKHDALGEFLRDHPVDADRRAESRLDENGRVVDEIVGSTLTPQCDCVTILLVKTSRIWKTWVR